MLAVIINAIIIAIMVIIALHRIVVVGVDDLPAFRRLLKC